MSLAIIAIVSISIIWMYKWRNEKKQEEMKRLHRPSWKKDIVYLVQFPVSPHVRSISPFSLKLESWLILNKIPYENVYSLKFSRKGQIPYIELNGEQMADSNIIIQTLAKQFSVTCDEGLTEVDQAIGHSMKRMLEHHTATAGFLWRYGYHMPEFIEKLMANYQKKPKAIFFFKLFQPIGSRFGAKIHGIGRHSMEEVAEFSSQDLSAISRILGDKKYLFKTSSPTTFDCTVFGHLAQFLYIPMDFPQKEFIHKECPNLVKYMSNIRDELWPDWQAKCQPDCMEGHMGWDLEKYY